MNREVMLKHRRAFLLMGNFRGWAQHKVTCPDCGGAAPKIETTESEQR